MAENLNKRPGKSILKSSTSFEKPDGAGKRKPKETKWDEMNILATLHPADKDYGHMKIEEPKTPYSYDVGDDEPDVLDANLLAEKIKLGGSEPRKSAVRVTTDSSSSDDDETPEERAKRKVFESKRKAHYNEYHAVKLARKLMDVEDEIDQVTETEAVAGTHSSDFEASVDLVFCGIEGCPGHPSNKTMKRCEQPTTTSGAKGKADAKHKVKGKH